MIQYSVCPATGRLEGVRYLHSPNQNARPDPDDISLVVLHGISLPPGTFHAPWIEALFTNQLPAAAHPFFGEIADLAVSCHLLIRRDGACVQFVPLHQRAWHAGRSAFDGRAECNDFAVGIELEGTDDTPYTEAQYQRLIPILEALQAAYPAIEPPRIVGHCHIAPGRKTDPGPAFDWQRVRRALAAR